MVLAGIALWVSYYWNSEDDDPLLESDSDSESEEDTGRREEKGTGTLKKEKKKKKRPLQPWSCQLCTQLNACDAEKCKTRGRVRGHVPTYRHPDSWTWKELGDSLSGRCYMQNWTTNELIVVGVLHVAGYVAWQNAWVSRFLFALRELNGC